ncbi:hypothetical protein [Actinomadura livida]|nr:MULTISPECIES: hypothetical protein [Actinomadura]MBB4774457.1 hypothetical protein [Actinomadura catellatispora]
MTGSFTSHVTDMHLEALLALLVEGPEEWLERYGETIKNENNVGYSLLIYHAFNEALRLRFSPTYTVPQIIRFVADLRLTLKEYAHELDPRVAESLIRYSLGDDAFTGRPPFGTDEVTVMRAQLLMLVALVSEEELDEAELVKLVKDSAALARNRGVVEQGQDSGV